jgi:hypothetical protein
MSPSPPGSDRNLIFGLLGDLLKCGDVPRPEATAVSDEGWCVIR